MCSRSSTFPQELELLIDINHVSDQTEEPAIREIVYNFGSSRLIGDIRVSEISRFSAENGKSTATSISFTERKQWVGLTRILPVFGLSENVCTTTTKFYSLSNISSQCD